MGLLRRVVFLGIRESRRKFKEANGREEWEYCYFGRQKKKSKK
jgi:hypothetical protein